MTSPSANPTPITPPRVPFFDERSGLISREWYMFFLSLFRNTASTDLMLLGPAVQDQSGELAAAVQNAQLATQLSAVQAELAALQTSVQALELAPPRREFKRSRYGSFYDTTTQTAAVANTAYAMTFNTTDLSSGVRLRSPSTSEVEVDTEGVYDLQFSAQLDNTSGGNHTATIWLRVNGVNVVESAGRLVLKGTDGDLVASWNYFQQFKAGDYFQIMWSVSDTAVQLVATAATPPAPGVASVILTVSNNIQGVQ